GLIEASAEKVELAGLFTSSFSQSQSLFPCRNHWSQPSRCAGHPPQTVRSRDAALKPPWMGSRRVCGGCPAQRRPHPDIRPAPEAPISQTKQLAPKLDFDA